MGALKDATFDVVEIPIAQIHGAKWNANRVDAETMRKIERSLELFGIVENSVVRTLPNPCPYCELMTELPHYEILSGNHRGIVYERAGRTTMPCVIRDLPDGEARVFADMLNRSRGQNDPDAYRLLLEQALEEVTPAYIASLLPETEETIRKIIADVPAPADVSGLAETQLWGVVVECRDEAEQADLLERLNGDGYTARALML